MKKIAIFFIVIVFIVISMLYLYTNYTNDYNKIKEQNQIFEAYYEEEINGTTLATIINKAMDTNYKNEVEKNSTGKYIENDSDSINIDIKMIDNDTTYNMETISNGGIGTFVTYYGKIKFKCTKIEYHEKTKKIRYMLFEQITQ